MYVVIGDDGRIFGPFTFVVDAEAWIDRNDESNTDWKVYPLDSPGEGYAWIR